MIRAALILGLLASPANAQGMSDTDAYFDVVLACLTVGAKLSMMEEYTRGTWAHELDEATKLHTFKHPGNSNALLRMEEENLDDPQHICDAISLTIPTEGAKVLLEEMLTTNGLPYTGGATDDLGCPAYANEFGWIASVSSGGESPTCDDPSKSTVRVIRNYD